MNKDELIMLIVTILAIITGFALGRKVSRIMAEQGIPISAGRSNKVDLPTRPGDPNFIGPVQ